MQIRGLIEGAHKDRTRGVGLLMIFVFANYLCQFNSVTLNKSIL
jgi:hypothetical protein